MLLLTTDKRAALAFRSRVADGISPSERSSSS